MPAINMSMFRNSVFLDRYFGKFSVAQTNSFLRVSLQDSPSLPAPCYGTNDRTSFDVHDILDRRAGELREFPFHRTCRRESVVHHTVPSDSNRTQFSSGITNKGDKTTMTQTTVREPHCGRTFPCTGSGCSRERAGFENLTSGVTVLNEGITRQMSRSNQFNEEGPAAQDDLSLVTYPNGTRKYTFKPSTL